MAKIIEWTHDPRVALRAGPDFDLATMKRRSKPGFPGNRADGEAFMRQRGALLSELQERLYAEGRAGGTRSILCIVQGLDTAGKGGVARHVMALVDPQGVQVHAFDEPTAEERKHHYLWRIKKALPPPGHIGVFDRSHYEDVLAVRVNHLAPRSVWEPRYDEINRFEQKLVESGTTILKFALMVSHDEQGLRLMERLDRPDKHWKFSENDLATRAQWDDYQDAYQDVLTRTSTDWAPWYVIPADRKWYSRAAIIEILTQTLVEMDLGWPEPEWDPFDMRPKLAQMMSPAALRASLAETEDNVASAIAEDEAVEREAIEVSVDDEDASEHAEARAARAQVEADRATALAELTRTREQKRQLIREAEERLGS